MKSPPLSKLSRPAQWGILLVLTVIVTLALRAIYLPGALLIGPMIAGIICALNGAKLAVHKRFYQGAQATIGCLIAATMTLPILRSFLHAWPTFVGVVLASLALSTFLGWCLCKFRVMPKTTGIWGVTPGAASAMVVMADIYGADVRLVAVMQYLRVMCVAVAASVAAHFFAGANLAANAMWFAPVPAVPLLETIAIALVGGILAVLIKLPSGMMLIPLFAGAALNVTGLVHITVPLEWQVLAFVAIGWTIGLRFTHRVLLYSLRAMPKILASIAILMIFCALLGIYVSHALNVDMLTAFLATSPGGADVMVVIAGNCDINLAFVMGLQVIRLIIVVGFAPPLAKWMANRMNAKLD